MEKEASTDLVEIQGGSLHSTEPRGQLSAELKSSSPQGRPCPAVQPCTLRPLGDVGVRGLLNPRRGRGLESTAGR